MHAIKDIDPMPLMCLDDQFFSKELIASCILSEEETVKFISEAEGYIIVDSHIFYYKGDKWLIS